MTQNPILKRVRFRRSSSENRLSTEYIYRIHTYVCAMPKVEKGVSHDLRFSLSLAS